MKSPEDKDRVAVGAEHGTLRLWIAKEAMRQGELRIAAQTAHLTAIEGRAASLLGWTVTLALAALTLAIKPPSGAIGWAALAVIICCMGAALFAGATIWPRSWGVAALSPSDLLDNKDARASELEFIEGIAMRHEAGVANNYAGLNLRANLLRASWIFLVAAPIAATGAAVLVSSAIPYPWMAEAAAGSQRHEPSPGFPAPAAEKS